MEVRLPAAVRPDTACTCISGVEGGTVDGKERGDAMNTGLARGGFTLIELMVVVIIIAALAGMVLPRVLPVSDEAKAKIAEGDVANITTALSMFHLKNDRYPTSDEGLKVLYPDYLEKQAHDPWKRVYQYKCPGSHNTKGFDLWSQGKDVQSEADDIPNWKSAE
jgi:general secretion pathway protein G